MAELDISVVIVNWNTRDLLLGCLSSLTGIGGRGPGVGEGFGSPKSSPPERHSLRSPIPDPRPPIEVIVVDNASTDGSAEAVRSRHPDVKLIASEENLGWAKGNNVGIEAAQGRYIFLLNPDTVVEPGALETLMRFMDDRPDAGACAPKLLNPDGSVQPSLRRFPEPFPLLWDALGLSKLFPRSAGFAAYRMGDFTYDEITVVDQPMGAALFIRREALEQVGLIDEAFPIFFNDVDWCYRAVQAGWKIYFVPDAEVLHYGGSSTSQVKPRMVTESHRSLERFYDKHYRHRLSPPVFAAIMGLSRLAERLRIARGRGRR